MAWIKPEHSRRAVDRAGKTLLRPSRAHDRQEARLILGNWRSAHGYPLHALAMTLRNRSLAIGDGKHIVTQRLKRLVSIERKLQRLSYNATQIQDLGGCRVILPSITEVRELQNTYRNGRSSVFELMRQYDYIDRPKDSGYRSLHLVYRYDSPNMPGWKYMRVELQIRSVIQHTWATAVEAASFLTGDDLKASEGDAKWLRFFVLMSNWMSMMEQSPLVPDVHVDLERLLGGIANLARELDVYSCLESGAAARQLLPRYAKRFSGARDFLVHLDSEKRTIRVRPFREGGAAAEAYSQLEIEYAGKEKQHVVLVNADSLDSVRKGYQGFFSDTKLFLEAVRGAEEAREELRVLT